MCYIGQEREGAGAEGERDLWVALAGMPVLAGRLPRLRSWFSRAAAIWRAPPEALRAAGLCADDAAAVIAARARVDPAAEIRRLRARGIEVVTVDDAAYPAGLLNIHDPPPALYVRGTLDPKDAVAVAVIGARRATEYGYLAAARLAGDLAGSGVTVVSGLARGIDGAAHRGALRAGGRTLAVLGCGVDVTYPPEHRLLTADIIRHGAVLSELPVGTPPRRHYFPMRNRLISGLSLGVVVVEGTGRSGALITADFALEQGREVFAVPGPIFAPQSEAPHRLIAQGARLVTEAGDILEELGLARPASPRVSRSVTGEEQAVLAALSWEPKPIDRLVDEIGRPVAELAPLLLALEVRGLVRQVAGQRYMLHIEE